MMGVMTSFLVGAIGYSGIEILWRGYTHWTMTLTAGFCMAIFYIFNLNYPSLEVWQKCFAGMFIITVFEFVVGCITNIWLKWNVWSYANIPFNLYGQICLLYSFLWFLISIPMIYICDFIRHRVEIRF